MVKADSDLQTARLLIDSSGPYDTACFHSQQAIEKLLKALLIFHEQPIPRMHDLEELQQLILALQPDSELAELELFEATELRSCSSTAPGMARGAGRAGLTNL
ncbi:MAG TPA: HEPN domain-containing protein [Anaerolineae bacterium]